MKLLGSMFYIESAYPDAVQIRLNPEHAIYKAHFPGNPITPGVCIVQIVGEIVGERMGCKLQLRRIASLKFLQPISPIENQRLTVYLSSVSQSEEEDGRIAEVNIKGTITCSSASMTKFSIVYCVK